MRMLILIAIGLYLALLAAMYLFQRKLMYHPVTDIAAPKHYGLSEFTEGSLSTADGVRVQFWHRAPSANFPTVIYYHGNAGHIGDRASVYAALAQRGFGVMALSYRGYGKSEGSPSEAGLYADARAAIDHVTREKGVPLNRVILYGESLGTGVATQMAIEYEIAMLVLQAPYRSVSGRAGEMYFFIPVKQLIKDKFHSIKKIARVKAPLLIFHGEEDEVIPVRHGKSLFAEATAPKRAHFMPGVHHNDFDSRVISAHLLDFAKAHQLVP